MNDLQAPLRVLGQLLGNTIRHDRGDTFVKEVERIRGLAKSAGSGEGGVADLIEPLRGLEERDLVPMASAFSQILNLAEDRPGAAPPLCSSLGEAHCPVHDLPG